MEREQIIARIRLNIVFEKMVVAVLAGAFVSAMIKLVLDAAVILIGGGFRFQALAFSGLNAIYFGFVVFLAGFIASAGLALPLHNFLEKQKVTKIWPYLVLALIVQYAAASGALGHALTISDFSDLRLLVLIFPAPIIIWVFSKEMVPLWRAGSNHPFSPDDGDT